MGFLAGASGASGRRRPFLARCRSPRDRHGRSNVKADALRAIGMAQVVVDVVACRRVDARGRSIAARHRVQELTVLPRALDPTRNCCGCRPKCAAASGWNSASGSSRLSWQALVAWSRRAPLGLVARPRGAGRKGSARLRRARCPGYQRRRDVALVAQVRSADRSRRAAVRTALRLVTVNDAQSGASPLHSTRPPSRPCARSIRARASPILPSRMPTRRPRRPASFSAVQAGSRRCG